MLEKQKGGGDLHLVFGLVLPVPALALAGDEVGRGEGPLAGQLRHIVHDAVGIAEVPGLEAIAPLQPQPEGDAGVHHGLAVEHVVKVFLGDADVREDLQVRPPVDGGAGLFPVRRLDLQLLALLALDLALFEAQTVLVPVPPDGDVHILGGVLGGAGAQTVEAQGVFIVPALVVFVLAAGVQLAKDQLPVEALLRGVPVQRAAAAEILHLDGLVLKIGEGDEIAVTLPGLVDGVGEDLKDGVLAAVQPVGAEDDPGALAHPVRALQLGDAVVSVLLVCFCHKFNPLSL